MITERPDSSQDNIPYVDLVPAGDLIDVYHAQAENVRQLAGRLTEEKAAFRYGPDKWSVKQVIGHVTDTERICAYRLLCAARGDNNPMPAFDENAYVAAANFDDQPLGELFAGWHAARTATISLLQSLTSDALQNTGYHSGRPTTALAIACIIAGHMNHHLAILRDRYGV